jgi:hypothetical protein
MREGHSRQLDARGNVERMTRANHCLEFDSAAS